MTALLGEQGGTRKAINGGQVHLSFANSSLYCKKGYRSAMEVVRKRH